MKICLRHKAEHCYVQFIHSFDMTTALTSDLNATQSVPPQVRSLLRAFGIPETNNVKCETVHATAEYSSMLKAACNTDDQTAEIMFQQLGIDECVIHTVMDIRHEHKTLVAHEQ